MSRFFIVFYLLIIVKFCLEQQTDAQQVDNIKNAKNVIWFWSCRSRADIFLLSLLLGGGKCSPHGQVTNLDEEGQMRIYTPSVSHVLQEHLNSTDTTLGAPLENLVPGVARPALSLHKPALLAIVLRFV